MHKIYSSRGSCFNYIGVFSQLFKYSFRSFLKRLIVGNSLIATGISFQTFIAEFYRKDAVSRRVLTTSATYNFFYIYKFGTHTEDNGSQTHNMCVPNFRSSIYRKYLMKFQMIRLETTMTLSMSQVKRVN